MVILNARNRFPPTGSAERCIGIRRPTRSREGTLRGAFAASVRSARMDGHPRRGRRGGRSAASKVLWPTGPGAGWRC